MLLARHYVKQFTYIIFLILITTPWDTVTIRILLMRLLRLKSRSDLPRTIKPVNGRSPYPSSPKPRLLQLPLWDGAALRAGGRHCPRQKFSLRRLSTHPVLEGPTARRTNRPLAHQHPPHLCAALGLRAQLGLYFGLNLVTRPREGQKRGPSSRYCNQCHSQESRMLSLPCKVDLFS